MKKFTVLFILMIISILFNISSVSAQVITGVFDVYAEDNSVFVAGESDPPPDEPILLDTGIDLKIGDILTITASGLWSISPSNDYVDANGYVGDYNSGFVTGSLLGQISTIGPQMIYHGQPYPPLFFIGTNYSDVVNDTGRLYLGFNDTDFGNNLGYVTTSVTVTPIPEPSTMLLLSSGLLGLWGFKRKKNLNSIITNLVPFPCGATLGRGYFFIPLSVGYSADPVKSLRDNGAGKDACTYLKGDKGGNFFLP